MDCVFCEKSNFHFTNHICFADENYEHEEAPEEVEAVDDPEEDLEVAGVVAEAPGVVAVEDVVGHGEHPQEAQHQKQLGVQHLVGEGLGGGKEPP